MALERKMLLPSKDHIALNNKICLMKSSTKVKTIINKLLQTEWQALEQLHHLTSITNKTRKVNKTVKVCFTYLQIN